MLRLLQVRSQSLPIIRLILESVESMHPRDLSIAGLISALLIIGGCEKKSDALVDSTGLPPAISSAQIFPSSVNTDTINVGSTRTPDDTLRFSLLVTSTILRPADNIQPIVFASATDPTSSAIVASGQLADDGLAPDQVKGDGIFSGTIMLHIQRVQVGSFQVQVNAVGSNGFESNTVIKPLTIFRGNHAPTLSSLEAPDTVTLSSESQLLTLRVHASDQDGQADIARVFFNSYKPDNSPSSGNPFIMFDDGISSHGDLAAGDGTYGLVITLPPTTPIGTYRFEFQAVDRSNVFSPTIVHRVTIKQ